MKLSFLKLFLIHIILLLLLFSCSSNNTEFSDVQIAFMVGGGRDHSFARRVYKGARAAERLMGCSVDYYWSDWDREQMTLDFLTAIEKEPDGIAVMGHPGSALMQPVIDQAVRQGILVTSQNVPLPEMEERYQHRGFGYVGQDVYGSGRNLVKAAWRRYAPQQDWVVMVSGVIHKGNRGRRAQGILDELEEMGVEALYFDASYISTDKAAFEEQFRLFLKGSPVPDIIFFDHWTTDTLEILQDEGIDSSLTRIVAFDISDFSLQAMESGYVDMVQDQQPYLQGFLPVVQLCLSIKYGFSGLHILTDSSYIDSKELKNIAPLVEEEIR